MSDVKSYSCVYKRQVLKMYLHFTFGLTMVVLHSILSTMASDVAFDKIADKMERDLEIFEKQVAEYIEEFKPDLSKID